MTETLHRLRLLMVARVVVVTTLLLAAFVVELVFHPARSLEPLAYLSALAAAAYALTLAHALVARALPRWGGQVWLQLGGDVLLCTGFVHLTGGPVSPFSFLYVAVIVAGGVIRYRRGAVLIAAASSLAYGGLTALMINGVLSAYPPGSFTPTPAEVTRATLTLLGHVLGFGLLALLAAALSESLRRTGAELVEARDSLEDLQAFNMLIIDSVNSGLVTSDPHGRITFLNRAAREITGLTGPAALDHPFAAVFGLGTGFLDGLRAALGDQRRHRFEVAFRVGSGLERVLGFTASRLRDRAGTPLGFIFTFQDLTEIKALEGEVLLRERMSAVGEMAAGMAHELRNPLGAISGSVQELRRAWPGAAGEPATLLDILRREALRLDQVLTDFLAFARPRPFAPVQADLAGLLRDLARLLRNAPEFGPRHTIEVLAPATLFCRCDINRLKQVFWNLALNALRAMPAGGALIVEAGRADGQVWFHLADTGQGMTALQIRDYFRPFTSRFDGGTGLGNAIVYRIVEEHEGRIEVQSQPGRGTRVRVTLPEGPAAPMTSEAAWRAARPVS